MLIKAGEPLLQQARRVALFLGLLTGLAGGMGVAQAQVVAADDLARFVAWWSGEWNNNEQVWQQAIDAANPKVTRKEDPVAHWHQIVTPLALPQLGAQVLYVQQSQGADLAQVQRSRLLRLTFDTSDGSIRQESFGVPQRPELADAHRRPEALAALAALPASALTGNPACVVLWRFDAAAQVYNGSLQGGSCKVGTAAPGPALQASSVQKLGAEQWLAHDTLHDGAGALVEGNKTDTAMRSRKVRYYEGWVWFKLAGPGAAADDKNTSFTAKYLLHNEGQRMVVMQQDGKPSPYLLELAVLTYQNTRRPVLKLALLDRQTLKTLSYVWSAANTPTLGMNLQWFQAGVTLKAERPAFGY